MNLNWILKDRLSFKVCTVNSKTHDGGNTRSLVSNIVNFLSRMIGTLEIAIVHVFGYTLGMLRS